MSLYDRDYMREPARRSVKSAVQGMSAFQIILGINLAVFVMQFIFEVGWLSNPETGALLMPLGGVSIDELIRRHVWTLLTYMFVHGSAGHFLMNMVMLWFAGRGVQQLLGSRHFALIYLLGGIVGAAAELAVNGYLLNDTHTTLIGASASAFGLLMALAVILPDEEITALIYFIIPVRLRLWTLVKGLSIIQLVFGVLYIGFDFLPEGFKIAYFAHLGGAALGWFYARSLGYGGRPLTYAAHLQVPSPHVARRPEMVRSIARSEVELGHESASDQGFADPVESFIEQQVNPILDKISQFGLASLTEEEQRTLARASEEMNRRRHDRG